MLAMLPLISPSPGPAPGPAPVSPGSGPKAAAPMTVPAPPPAPPPGLDCNAAASPVERAICVEAGLRALEDRMRSVLGQALAAGKIEERTQLGWLRIREETCRDDPAATECIDAITRRRIAYLDDLVANRGWQVVPLKDGQRQVALMSGPSVTMGITCSPEGPTMLVISTKAARPAVKIMVRVDGKAVIVGSASPTIKDGDGRIAVPLSAEELIWLRRGTRASFAFDDQDAGEVSLAGSNAALGEAWAGCKAGRS